MKIVRTLIDQKISSLAPPPNFEVHAPFLFEDIPIDLSVTNTPAHPSIKIFTVHSGRDSLTVMDTWSASASTQTNTSVLIDCLFHFRMSDAVWLQFLVAISWHCVVAAQMLLIIEYFDGPHFLEHIFDRTIKFNCLSVSWLALKRDHLNKSQSHFNSIDQQQNVVWRSAWTPRSMRSDGTLTSLPARRTLANTKNRTFLITMSVKFKQLSFEFIRIFSQFNGFFIQISKVDHNFLIAFSTAHVHQAMLVSFLGSSIISCHSSAPLSAHQHHWNIRMYHFSRRSAHEWNSSGI